MTYCLKNFFFQNLAEVALLELTLKTKVKYLSHRKQLGVDEIRNQNIDDDNDVNILLYDCNC